MPSALCELPNELLANIAEHLQFDFSALRSLARTSRSFQAIAEPVLYRSIFFRNGAQLYSLQDALACESWRYRSIHTVNVRWSHQTIVPAKGELDALGDLISAAPNIEDLTIESPYCNQNAWRRATTESGWSRTMDSWLRPIVQAAKSDTVLSSPRPLQSLKRLTLHLNGTSREFWTMDRGYAWILAHPTLEDLHLSSINLIRDFSKAVAYPRFSTPLKRLTLDETNVTLDGLRSVLSFPKALQYLYVGENRYSHAEQAFPPQQRYNCLPMRDVQALMEVLRLQKHSLQSLTYISNETSLGQQGLSPRTQMDTDFSMFEVLHEMSLSGCNEAAMSTWCAQNKGPPCLQKLTVDEYVYIDVEVWEGAPSDPPHRFFKDIMSAAPQLKRLDVIGTCTFDLTLLPVSGFRNATAIAGQYLAQKGCIARFLRGPSRGRIVRPVLYGEVEPANILMYVNDEDGFRVPERLVSPDYLDDMGSDEELSWDALGTGISSDEEETGDEDEMDEDDEMLSGEEDADEEEEGNENAREEEVSQSDEELQHGNDANLVQIMAPCSDASDTDAADVQAADSGGRDANVSSADDGDGDVHSEESATDMDAARSDAGDAESDDSDAASDEAESESDEGDADSGGSSDDDSGGSY
ncbi:hypothetical protein LTS16_013610 [Friedmanniomyces endolithicus]|nr:hypothetical protein LTS09_016160 [Friedmanniomyces endolithicus]KAK1036589.1 hypothetical protein LTS16_013610 [Friedmanniomyces endolithicus]